MRLIDADVLKKDVLDLPNCYNGFSDTFDKACIIGLIDEQSTIEERKKGKWIHKPNIYGVAYCSECDYELHTNDTNYCPNCGADMRESNRLLNNCSRCRYGKNYLNNMWWCEKHDMMKNREGESCSDFKNRY